MQIYNKGQRCFIVALKDVTPAADAVPQTDKLRYSIKPQAIVEVSDDAGNKLMALYPHEIVEWGKR
jgi:hypothetical protein